MLITKVQKHNSHRVELFLHPTWFHKGVEIRHEHEGKHVVFQAFNDGQPLPKTEVLEASEVMSHGCRADFYNAHAEEWDRLVER